jgi:hypothetical protein
MASRIVNRRQLREPATLAETAEAAAPAARTPPKARAKTAAAPKARKVRPKKVPPRMRARWGVFDGGLKQVAIFDYNQRAAADEKLADLQTKKKGIHFLQIVKEPMPEPVSAGAPPAG